MDRKIYLIHVFFLICEIKVFEIWNTIHFTENFPRFSENLIYSRLALFNISHDVFLCSVTLNIRV